jgi:regulator of protease activity HflC (stomatin/prohibitin superfamily)
MDETKMQGVAYGCGCLVIVILGFIFLGGVQIVQPSTSAVVTRLGTLDGSPREAGLYLDIPFLSRYTYYDLKTKLIQEKYDGGSIDGQFVYVTTGFTYSLKSDQISKLYQSVGSQEDLENKFIKPTLSDVVKQVTAQYKAGEVLQKQSEFRDRVKELIVGRMNQEYLSVVDIQIVNIDFSTEYNTALEQKQIAEQSAIKDKQIAQQNVEKQRLENEKNLLQKNYELDASKIDAERQRLIQQSLTQELLQKMWIEKWNGVLPTTMTGSGTGFYLPVK